MFNIVFSQNTRSLPDIIFSSLLIRCSIQ